MFVFVLGVCVREVGRGGMFGEECLPPRCGYVSDVNCWRAGASAFAPSAPILLPGRCAGVVVGAGTGQYIFVCAVVTVLLCVEINSK